MPINRVFLSFERDCLGDAEQWRIFKYIRSGDREMRRELKGKMLFLTSSIFHYKKIFAS